MGSWASGAPLLVPGPLPPIPPSGWQSAPWRQSAPGPLPAFGVQEPGTFMTQKHQFFPTGFPLPHPLSIWGDLCLQGGCLFLLSEAEVTFCPRPASQGLLPGRPLGSVPGNSGVICRTQSPHTTDVIPQAHRCGAEIPLIAVILLLRIIFLPKDPVKMQMLAERGNTLTYYHPLSLQWVYRLPS